MKKSELQGISLEKFLDKTYGKVGTKKRDTADKRIKKISKNLVSLNKKKSYKSVRKQK